MTYKTRSRTILLLSALCMMVFAGLSWGNEFAIEGGAGAPTIVQAFTGQDDSAHFQAALDDALLQAQLFYETQGADIRFNYRILKTTGERGGFAFVNIVRVHIVTWAFF